MKIIIIIIVLAAIPVGNIPKGSSTLSIAHFFFMVRNGYIPGMCLYVFLKSIQDKLESVISRRSKWII